MGFKNTKYNSFSFHNRHSCWKFIFKLSSMRSKCKEWNYLQTLFFQKLFFLSQGFLTKCTILFYIIMALDSFKYKCLLLHISKNSRNCFFFFSFSNVHKKSQKLFHSISKLDHFVCTPFRFHGKLIFSRL